MDRPWKVITAFIGVFVAGAVFGAFFSLGIGWRILERHAQSTPPVTPSLALAVPPPAAPKKATPEQPWPVSQPMQAAQIIRRLAARLDLTPAQRERVMPLIQRAVEDFRRQQANYFREDAFILQRLQNDIAKELTPEQRTRLAEMEARQRELLRKRQAEWQALQKSWENGGAAAHPAPPNAAPKSPDEASAPSTSTSSSIGSTSTPATQNPPPKEKEE